MNKTAYTLIPQQCLSGSEAFLALLKHTDFITVIPVSHVDKLHLFSYNP